MSTKAYIFKFYSIFRNFDDNESRRLNELLKILLAESINSREKALTSQIREVQRCLGVFDSRGYGILFIF